ncbi:MAG: acetyl-CoA carboxylase carboxyltransferase subunit alpha [Fusobacteriaceae bacterium]|nr:acetyl-CoA carboxylase carboxyltransferase subunit alpha [Fusobacteriaceae bacterium]MBP9510668.1 acetyl-CoA carboxylase carboxyltransferase subunit alpha [Fusobacteriaceae bacterium]
MKFEEKVQEIEQKLAALIKFSEEKKIDLSSEIEKLTVQRDEVLKETYSKLTSWDKIFVARHPERPYTLDYIEQLGTNFVELHGDRLFKDDPAIVGGLCKIDGKNIMVIGHQKGRTTEEKIHRNFGMPNPEGYRKALRLMRMAEKFNVPILTLIDTPGAYPGIEAEEHGQGEAIAKNLMEMAGIKVPMISVVIGEGGSGGALALGVTDKIYMLQNAVYSVISPEGCAAILFKDASRAPEAAESLKISAADLVGLNIIDGIIEEPVGGAHRDHKCIANNLKKVILESFSELEKLNVETLLENRYTKFRSIGKFF